MGTTTRRVLLGAIAVAPVAACAVVPVRATPAGPNAQTPFRVAEARYRKAQHRFNNLPSGLEHTDPDAFAREEAAYLAAVDAVDTAAVADWHEFASQFAIGCDDGVSLPKETLVFKLLDDARRLGGLA